MTTGRRLSSAPFSEFFTFDSPIKLNNLTLNISLQNELKRWEGSLAAKDEGCESKEQS